MRMAEDQHISAGSAEEHRDQSATADTDQARLKQEPSQAIRSAKPEGERRIQRHTSHPNAILGRWILVGTLRTQAHL